MGIFNNLQNDWMHVNIVWRSNWLEWLIVTPRYHHIHHSDKPEHYMANLGTLFTVWDRSVRDLCGSGVGEGRAFVRDWGGGAASSPGIGCVEYVRAYALRTASLAVHLKHLPIFQSHRCQLPSPHTAAIDGQQIGLHV